MRAHATGSPACDELLGGGYEKGIITTVYGPAGSGKSNLMLLATANVEKRAIFVDPEGSFSVDRLKQLNPDVDDLLERLIIIKPTSFEQQHDAILRLPKMISENIELVIIDSIASQYRAQLARDGKEANSKLSQQINALFAVASDNDIPVLVTSQVYADFEGDGVNVVGGDIVKYSSKCMIELQNEDGKRSMIVRKHRFLPAGKSINFSINNIGIHEEK